MCDTPAKSPSSTHGQRRCAVNYTNQLAIAKRRAIHVSGRDREGPCLKNAAPQDAYTKAYAENPCFPGSSTSTILALGTISRIPSQNLARLRIASDGSLQK